MTTEVLNVPGTDCPADSSNPGGDAYTITTWRLVDEALYGNGENDDAVWDEAERMAAAGETGPVMLDVDPPDMAAIEAAGIAAYHAEVARDPERQRLALERRAERHARHDRMVERAFYVAPSFARAPERRPREQRHGRRPAATRAGPDDDPHELDPPPALPQLAADVAHSGDSHLGMIGGAR